MEDKPFRLSIPFIEKYKKIKPPFGFNGLGELVYMRTYSRKKKNGANERWWETIQRVVEGTYNIQKNWIEQHRLGWNGIKAQYSAQEMYDRMFNMKILAPGRGLYAQGTDIITKKKLTPALFNCSFVSTENIKNDPGTPFTFAKDMLMCGVGVGADLLGAGTVEVEAQLKEEKTFVIPDSREGWVESLDLLIKSFFRKIPKPVFDYSLIRKKGAPIKTFGGVSSGPEPLKIMHEQITKTLAKNINKPISIRTIADIFNHIGKTVVAGNVRRCLPENTLIHTEHGLVPIQNLQKGQLVWTSNNLEKITEVLEQGIQSVMSINTQLGSFECTKKHEIAVLTDIETYKWVKADDIRPGDRLVFPKHIIVGKQTTLPPWKYAKPNKHSTTCKDITIPTLDVNLSHFFGLLHGDGCVWANKKNKGFNAYVSIACSPDYPKIVAKAKKQLQRFGTNVNVRGKKGNGAVIVHTQSKQLAWYLSQFKQPSITIDIPSFILQGTPNIKASYLAGLLDADGCSKTRPINLVTSIYPEFLKQVQALYASLGMPTRLTQRRLAKNNWQALYCLNLVGKLVIKDFNNLVGIYSLKYDKKEKNSQNDYGYPNTFVNTLKFQGLWDKACEQMTVATYEKISGDKIHLIPIKVKNIDYNVRKINTYDISVKNAKEFITQEGLLVHNSAILLSGPPKEEFLDLKDYDKNPDRIDFGWASNNSVSAKVGTDYKEIADRIRKNGEPGLLWLENAHEYGRFGESNSGLRSDTKTMGTNPCGEIFLESGEKCNLCEVFLDKQDSEEDFKRSLKYAYLYSKTVTLLDTHWTATNQTMLRNRRVGTGVGAIAQFLAKNPLNTLKSWLDSGYHTLQRYDEIYSDWLAIPRSIRLSTVKPSGSISLLAGSTPGIHYPESRFYIRRVRLASDSSLIPPLEKAGYKIEKAVGQEDSTSVVEIPVDVGKGVRTLEEVSMWEQLEMAAFMQKYWADNSVSVTISFNPETEGPQIEKALDIFQYKLKSVSFLPRLKGGAYKQMPYEKISQEQYNTIVSQLKKPSFAAVRGHQAKVDKFCNNDTCVIL